jgi:GntR family transcriptional regulator
MTTTKRVQRRSAVARHHQLYTLLSQALSDGSIKAGGALPSESALMREHAVSRNTVRRALGKLEREKRIVRRRGSGSYAREQPGGAVTWMDVVSVVQDMRRIEKWTTWRLLHFGFVSTPDHVLAQAPKFEPRSLLIQRTRAIRGCTYALITSYVTESVANRLTRRSIGKCGVLVAVEDCGMRLATCEQSTNAISANAIVAEQLGVPAGAPLFYIERISYTEDDTPVEFAEITYATNLYQQRLIMRLDRTGNTLCWIPVGFGKAPRGGPTTTSLSPARGRRGELNRT